MTIRERYQSKENRDARYRELVARYGKEKVSRSSTKGACLHPEYVRDWGGDVGTGIGNVQYKTFFAVLYTVEVRT